MKRALNTFADIHAHSRVGENVLTSAEPDAPRNANGWYSVGIHPWRTEEPIPDALWDSLEAALGEPNVVAVGECGLDKLRGGSPATQEAVFLRQAELSEKYELPLIIHCVGRYGRLMELHRKLSPRQLWVVHGFRGKPELARQLAAQGIAVSIGAHPRPDISRIVPPHLLFSETDT